MVFELDTKPGVGQVDGGFKAGKTTRAFNGGDGSKIIGSVGIRFSY